MDYPKGSKTMVCPKCGIEITVFLDVIEEGEENNVPEHYCIGEGI
jgi:hypothetical protein